MTVPFNKQDIINAAAAETGLSKRAVTDVLDAIIGNAASVLRDGHAVEIRGFVKLTPTERAARTGRNPATGETITIPAKTVVKATAAKSLIGGA